MHQEQIRATGRLRIEIRDQFTGELKDVREIDNLVVTVGKNWIASRMTATPTAMSHMAVGTSSASPTVGDTTLGSEAARVALDSQSTTNNVTTYTATFPAGTGTGALVEAGLFNNASGGTMLARTTFAVVNKGAADAMTVTWTVTVS